MAKSTIAVEAAPPRGKNTPEEEQPRKRAKKPHSLASAISGAISGSLISACVQPLDVVRTKMQADAARGVVRGTLETARVVLKEQGLRGMWSGTGPSVIRVGLGAGMHFVLLEQIRWLLSTPTQDGGTHLSNTGAALSGGLSRAVAAILLCPVTVVKTRMEYVADNAVQAATKAAAAAAGAGAAGAAGAAATPSAAAAAPAAVAAAVAATGQHAARAAASAASGATAAAVSGTTIVPLYRNTGDALATILRTEGLRGLFRGVWPTVFTNAPYSGLYYMFYTRLKEGLSGEGRPQAAVNFTSGVAAAVAATLLTQPADVVRTRMQLGLAGGAAAGGAGAAAAGAWVTLREALRQQGPAALMIGAPPRILKRTAQTALVWTLYEELVPRISQLGAAAKQAWDQHAGGAGAGTGTGASVAGKRG